MTIDTAIPYISFVVDDSGNARKFGGQWLPPGTPVDQRGLPINARLVGWQCGFEPLFVLVYSYLGVHLNENEAEELAKDYLIERGWFAGKDTDADYIL